MTAIGKFKELLHAPIVPLLLYVFNANSFFQISLIYAPTAGRLSPCGVVSMPLQGETTKMAGSSLTPAKVQPNDSCRSSRRRVKCPSDLSRRAGRLQQQNRSPEPAPEFP